MAAVLPSTPASPVRNTVTTKHKPPSVESWAMSVPWRSCLGYEGALGSQIAAVSPQARSRTRYVRRRYVSLSLPHAGVNREESLVMKSVESVQEVRRPCRSLWPVGRIAAACAIMMTKRWSIAASKPEAIPTSKNRGSARNRKNVP